MTLNAFTFYEPPFELIQNLRFSLTFTSAPSFVCTNGELLAAPPLCAAEHAAHSRRPSAVRTPSASCRRRERILEA